MKMLVVSFNDTEEMIFKQTLEWLSNKLSTTPATLVEQKSDLLYFGLALAALGVIK